MIEQRVVEIEEQHANTARFFGGKQLDGTHGPNGKFLKVKIPDAVGGAGDSSNRVATSGRLGIFSTEPDP